MKFKELKNLLQTFDNGGYEDYVVLDSIGNIVDCITCHNGYIVVGNDKAIKKPKRTPPKLWNMEQIEKTKELWLKGYEPCIIAEIINRSDREIVSILERYKYFGIKPDKYSSKNGNKKAV